MITVIPTTPPQVIRWGGSGITVIREWEEGVVGKITVTCLPKLQRRQVILKKER